MNYNLLCDNVVIKNNIQTLFKNPSNMSCYPITNEKREVKNLTWPIICREAIGICGSVGNYEPRSGDKRIKKLVSTMIVVCIVNNILSSLSI